MPNDNEEIIDTVMHKVVSSVRQIHFAEGSSTTARTRKIKEIIEQHSKKFELDAT